MRTSKLLAAILVLAAGGSLRLTLGAGVPVQAKIAAVNPVAPLVRTDLLARVPTPAGPPKRNIFSAQAASAGRAAAVASPGAVTAGLPLANAAAGTVLSQAPAEAPPAATPAFSVDLRYIGFVDSRRTGKIIGLVIFQGQARAVNEGEVISEGIRIGQVSREAIEVILPDSSRRTFPLEGEE